MQANNHGVRTWLEIDKSALKNNYDQFRQIIEPSCRLMAVCKSNAYGHGLVDYAKTMVFFGVDWLGVDSITEALRLRKEGIETPILVLGYTLPENFGEALENNISLTISSIDSLKAIQNFLMSIHHPLPLLGEEGNSKSQDNAENPLIHNTNPKIHIKIDTGMHRQGFQKDEVEEAAKFIKENLPDVEVEGLYTHFASAKNPAFRLDTKKQLAQFERARAVFEQNGFMPICHAAATAGTLLFPEAHFDMVRIGIGLMGYWPSLETREAKKDVIDLKPALVWKTIISEVKNISAGESIGYDYTEKLHNEAKIAILPIGYWHGYRRNLSGVGRVLVGQKKARILGRISMDMIVIDITGLDLEVGDEVVILGSDGKEEISIYEMARLSDTSWYETITCINPLIKKVYV